jgi:poly[(R)-3-hydroxyalkanoate] polymerase subunit PhaE
MESSMNDKPKENVNGESLLQVWLKTATEFWGTAGPMWTETVKSTEGSESSETEAGNRMMDTWRSTAKSWQTLGTILQEPEAMEGLLKGINTFPEILAKMLQPGLEGVLHLQKEFAERAARIGKSTAAYKFENLDQEAFKAWNELYQNEFSKFLKMPQVGLTRGYQERLNEAADKFNVFQASMAEFVSLVYLPMEKSLQVMQKKITELADKGHLPEKSKEYYRMWLKILEGHYMTLFKSPEYTQTIAKTLDALAEFSAAKQEVLQDALQFLPIPNQKDMDELYKEIYLLKKRVRELERNGQQDGKASSN